MGKHKVIICLFAVKILIWGLGSEKGGQQKRVTYIWILFFFFWLGEGWS